MIKMIFKKKIFALIISLFIFCSILPAKTLKKSLITITRQDGSSIDCIAELAEKAEDRNHGFMNRKNIPDGSGMLFIFENEQILSFWMKNTPHPLSIAYIDSRGKIRNIYDMTPFSLSSIVSTVSCRYALEVPQGWFKKNGITTGDSISLNF